MPGDRWNTVPWMSWSPNGDRLAYFVRTEKERTLIVQNVLTRKIEAAHPDEDGRRARVARLLARRPDGGVRRRCATRSATSSRSISRRRQGRQPHRATSSATTAPSYSPDGKFIVYTARVSGNEKLFRLDLDTKKKTQLTFGTHDETGAQFIDDHTLVFSSTATDPDGAARSGSGASNGNIFNIWTLDLKNGELRQYTDAVGGNLSPIVLRRRQDQPHRVRQLLQGRLQHPHARAQGAAAHRRSSATSARRRADHRLPGAAAAHAGEGEQAQEGHVREDVPRGAAAGERRRHQQRRHLRRHARSASATCSATSRSTSSPRRSRSTARCRCRT